MSAAVLSRRRWPLPLLGALLSIRLLSLGAYPLTDTTEARYGEIVRKMVELGDWVTPWFDYGVPFWGKPPLAFWLSAASASLLGVSEFSLRLPSFLLGLAMLVLVGTIARRQWGAERSWVSMLALASGVLFFISSGAVLTDTALACAIALAMVAFWCGVAEPAANAARWRYVWFAALGLGLLAKGPVALVLTGAPIVVWALLSRRVTQAAAALPWLGGTILLLAIVTPWYVLAEMRTPGFLDYFLIGENFRRFTDPHWAGDLYGNVHTSPKGYIWLLWLGAAAPWSLLAVGWIVYRLLSGGRLGTAPPSRSSWRLYLLCFALAPAAIFTLAGSVLPTYLLPGMPALALLVAELWPVDDERRMRLFGGLALLPPLLFAAALPWFNAHVAADRSQRELLAAVPDRAPVIYLGKRPFSGQYYSEGQAVWAGTGEQLENALAMQPDAYIVTWGDTPLPSALADHYRETVRSGERRRSVLWSPTARHALADRASR